MNSDIIVQWAVFGTKDGSEDVTDRVKELVKKSLTLEVTHGNLKSDPDPGHTKHFSICYIYGGKTLHLACEERQTLNLAQNQPIHIIGAIYGAKEGGYEVSQKVRDLINFGGETTIKASNSNFGDPAHGHTKHFGVVYKYNGHLRTRACEEGQTVTLN